MRQDIVFSDVLNLNFAQLTNVNKLFSVVDQSVNFMRDTNKSNFCRLHFDCLNLQNVCKTLSATIGLSNVSVCVDVCFVRFSYDSKRMQARVV